MYRTGLDFMQDLPMSSAEQPCRPLWLTCQQIKLDSCEEKDLCQTSVLVAKSSISTVTSDSKNRGLVESHLMPGLQKCQA